MRPFFLLLAFVLLARTAEARELRLLDRSLAIAGLRTELPGPTLLDEKLAFDAGGGSGSSGPTCEGVAVVWLVSWLGGLIGYFPAFLVAWAIGVNESPSSLGYTITFGIGLVLLRPLLSTLFTAVLVNASYHRQIRALWTLAADMAVTLAITILLRGKEATLNPTSTWLGIFAGSAAGAIVGTYFAEGHFFSSVAPRDEARPLVVAVAEPPAAVQVPVFATNF